MINPIIPAADMARYLKFEPHQGLVILVNDQLNMNLREWHLESVRFLSLVDGRIRYKLVFKDFMEHEVRHSGKELIVEYTRLEAKRLFPGGIPIRDMGTGSLPNKGFVIKHFYIGGYVKLKDIDIDIYERNGVGYVNFNENCFFVGGEVPIVNIQENQTEPPLIESRPELKVEYPVYDLRDKKPELKIEYPNFDLRDGKGELKVHYPNFDLRNDDSN